MSDVAGARRTAATQERSAAGKVLIIDDEAAIRESLQILLEEEGYEVANAEDGEEGLNILDAQAFDLVLLDFQLPGRNGLEILKEILQRDPETPVIMLTAYATPQNAVAAIQGGAKNFIAKPWSNEKLQADVRETIGRKRAQEENIQLKRQLKQRYNFENILGKSDLMLRTFDLVAQVAPSRSTILLQGESGTGKELIAKAIHANSPRKDRPFVPVNTGSFRPRQGSFHLRNQQQEGPLRNGRPGHHLPRRNRQHVDGNPGQAAARAARQAIHAPRRCPGNSG
jgi:DNA-binding NtrC family response regulator